MDTNARPIAAALVGATGYTGMELLRLLHGHTHIRLACATSRAKAGERLEDIHPFTRGSCHSGLIITEPDFEQIAATCQVAFLAVPHGAAMEAAAELHSRGVKVVDLSADFRLHNKEVYEAWYKVPHTRAELLPHAAYGLPELYADDIRKATLVANPGCYPTSVILGLLPALRNNIIATEGIVIDAKSGTTGAGRNAAVSTLFCEVQDSFRAYGLAAHRHTPEIEQELSTLANIPMTVSFNPHLLPINRGILSTIYATLPQNTTIDEIQAGYESAYAHKPWVRILPKGQLPELRHVRGTMFCDIGLVVDPRTRRLIVVACIDNLCRGAAGQALANANLMLGLPQEAGLDLAPLMP